MYGTDFWKRVSLQQVGEFLRRGSELSYYDTGTPEERYKQYKKALYDNLCDFRDKVIAYDNWAKCDEKEKEIITEQLWEEVICVGGDLEELAFEMGLGAGLTILRQIIEPLSQINAAKNSAE